MSLAAFYETVNGDYEGVKSRLISDERIEKFVGIFFDDPTYETLVKALGEQNMQDAFRAAHTLKGISRDLGLTEIAEPAVELADALRPDDNGVPAAPERADELLAQVAAAYQHVVEARALIG